MKHPSVEEVWLTFEEIAKEFAYFPPVRRWTARRLAAAVSLGAIDGEWCNTRKKFLFNRDSVAVFIEYMKERNRRKMIDILPPHMRDNSKSG